MYCGCGEELVTPHELRAGKCLDCESDDARFQCSNPGCANRLVSVRVGSLEPEFCSDSCERAYGLVPES